MAPRADETKRTKSSRNLISFLMLFRMAQNLTWVRHSARTKDLFPKAMLGFHVALKPGPSF
jgi:hypothetical protein